MTIEVQAVDANSLWREHCRNAVRKFVMHAVVIDNQPVLTQEEQSASSPSEKATLADEGMGDAPAEQLAETTEETPEAAICDFQDLDVRKISDAFAEQEIACAFVFPKNSDTDEKIFRRVMDAAMPADIVVIDWYLRDTNPNLSKKILKAIAEKDHIEKGRLRLICVYTGQPNTDEVTRDAVAELTTGGLISNRIDENGGLASGRHHCLLVLNKQAVDGSALPKRILEALTTLSEGILPSFALAAVAAIRRNVHHIITRFSSDLDAAFVANRLMTDPPSDVSELLRELFVSECDAALGLDKVADKYLDQNSITLWLDEKNQPLSQATYNNNQSINRGFLDGLLQNGIKEDMVTVGGSAKKFPKEKREYLSYALHGLKQAAQTGECKFSRHIALKREAFGMSKLHSIEGWIPSLTLGSILRQTYTVDGTTSKKYFYCLSPACDTLRLNDQKRVFLMVKIEPAQKKTNLIIAEEGGVNIALHIVPHPRNVRAFKFCGDGETGRVLARSQTGGDQGLQVFCFDSADDVPEEFVWLGEVRRNRANRDMAELNSPTTQFTV